MARLAIALGLVGCLVFVVWVLAGPVDRMRRDLVTQSGALQKETGMPDGFRNIAFVLLLLLLIGVATGSVTGVL